MVHVALNSMVDDSLFKFILSYKDIS